MILARQASAELVGTAFLVAAVVGSGIAAERLSPDDLGLQLLENSIATGAVLVALILALQPVSASFNPVVTLAERFLGVLTTATAAALVAAQVAGGLLGVIVANLMFDLDAVSVSTQERGGTGQLLGEVVATIGLVLVVFGTLRSTRPETVAFAVGGYITAAYWFTSSTSFADPAVTIAPHALRHLRWHRAGLGARLHRRRVRRRTPGNRIVGWLTRPQGSPTTAPSKPARTGATRDH